MKSRVRKSLLTLAYVLGLGAWVVAGTFVCVLFGWAPYINSVLCAPAGALAMVGILETWRPSP